LAATGAFSQSYRDLENQMQLYTEHGTRDWTADPLTLQLDPARIRDRPEGVYSNLPNHHRESNPDPLVNTFPQYDLVGVLADDQNEEESNSEDEGIEDYVKGGYHPVFRGEILNGRYVILQKLGWGHFSTVWLTRDVKMNTYVAIKIQKSENRYLEAAFDEVEILQKAVKEAHNPQWLQDLKTIYKGQRDHFEADDCHVVQLLNAFIYEGPYGRHFCMVFEILGVNLLEIIKRYDYRGIPLPICQEISRQVLIGLHYLHKYCGIIHTDLKPENVMVCLNQDELKQIVESGQLNNSKKIEKRLKSIKRKIMVFKGLPLVIDADELSDANLHDSAIHSTAPELSTRTTVMSTNDPNMNDHSQGNYTHLMTEQDVEREYEKKIKESQINKNEKRNLKKKLKKKMKQNQKNNEKKNYPVSMRNNMEIKQKEEKKMVSSFKFTADSSFAKSGLTDNFRIKIADLGNGCWTHHHFQPEIQTRQYRSPETILGIKYNETADIWSFACMLFEMLTGEFLFDPRKNPAHSKSTDHLKLMVEMLNMFPKKYSTIGSQSKKFVAPNGMFSKVACFEFKAMKDVLIRKYRVDSFQAAKLEKFLLPMLDIYPQKRISAFESLKSDWLEITENTHFHSQDPAELKVIEPVDFDPFLNSPEVFKRVVEEEDFDADKSRISALTEDGVELEDGDPEPNLYDREIKVFDRNFKNVYVGYADGIDLNHLDNTANWQFESTKH